MKNKYKVSEFKKGQLLMYYRHNNKLLCWTSIISKKGAIDVFEIAKLSFKHALGKLGKEPINETEK